MLTCLRNTFAFFNIFGSQGTFSCLNRDSSGVHAYWRGVISFHLSPVCLRPAGYATWKASWIPNSEREKLILSSPSRASTAVYLIILSSAYFPFPCCNKHHWPPYLTPPAPSSLSHLSPLTVPLAVKRDNSSQILSSRPSPPSGPSGPSPSPPHWHYSSPAGWGPGHMAAGGHVPETDVLVNLQHVRRGLFFFFLHAKCQISLWVHCWEVLMSIINIASTLEILNRK